MQSAVDYALNREKTETDMFESAINCRVEFAFDDMRATKEMYNKTDGVQGYHLIQSFADGEVSPELAHKIGVELAEKLLGKEYEVVIATHLNTNCYHNHIVFNSVNMFTGAKYRSNAKSYYTTVRNYSDELCEKYGLSKIVEPEYLKNKYAYNAWQAENRGETNWRSLIRQDINEAIELSLSWKQFVAKLSAKGYEMQFDKKYATLKPSKKERAVRFKTLGEQYTPKAIQMRILEPRAYDVIKFKQDKQAKPKFKKGSFVALYYHYLYLLGAFPKKPQSVPYSIRKDVVKLDKRIAQLDYLQKHKFETREQIGKRIDKLSVELNTNIKNRAKAYAKKSDTTEITANISDLRKEIKMCKDIITNSERMEKEIANLEISKKNHKPKIQNKKGNTVIDNKNTYNNLPLTLNVNHLQNALGISRASAYRLMKQDDFPTIKVGTRLLVPRDKFINWIDCQISNKKPDKEPEDCVA